MKIDRLISAAGVMSSPHPDLDDHKGIETELPQSPPHVSTQPYRTTVSLKDILNPVSDKCIEKEEVIPRSKPTVYLRGVSWNDRLVGVFTANATSQGDVVISEKAEEIFHAPPINHLSTDGVTVNLEGKSEKLRDLFHFRHTNGIISVIGEVSKQLNHSCTPTAVICYNKVTNELQVRTTRNLAINSELTIDYLGRHDWPNTAQRRATLQKTWGFTCTCSLCYEKEYSGQNKHHCGARRARLEDMLSRLQRPDPVQDPVDAEFDGNVFTNMTKRVYHYMTQVERVYGKGGKLSKSTVPPILDVRLADAYRMMADAHATSINSYHQTWLERSKRVLERLYGSDQVGVGVDLCMQVELNLERDSNHADQIRNINDAEKQPQPRAKR